MRVAIPEKYLRLVILAVWIAALFWGFNLINLSPYGLSEGAAKALLFLWSIVDRIANPVATFGTPDMRTLLLLPVAIYWSGSMLATKIFTAMLAFFGALLLYYWARKQNNESALMATALLLISPLMITQISTIGTGPMLLLTFGIGLWVSNTYRAKPRPLGGWYFVQLLVVMTAVSLHPAGLGYALALAWLWIRDPLNKSQQKQILIGLAIAVPLMISFQSGWQEDIHWFSDPLIMLSNAALNGAAGFGEPAGWFSGIIIALLLFFVIIRDKAFLFKDLMGSILLFSTLIGLVAATPDWAMIAIALLLYRGIDQLVTFNQSFNSNSLMGQRGLVVIVLMIVSTTFMLGDKQYRQILQSELLSPTDDIIQQLAVEASDHDKPFQAASQWPARTMLACRRDVFPLPMAAKDGATLLESIKGITHLTFDHNLEANRGLSKNLAELSGIAETLTLEEAGVIIHIKAPATEATTLPVVPPPVESSAK